MPSTKLLKAQLADILKLGQERANAIVTQPHPAPVLVFGNQKSGTSAISVLLGHATGLRTQMDFRGAWEPYLTPLLEGKTDLARFVRLNSYAFSAPIVKEPGLTFLAGRLAEHFSESPCIFIVRDPFQNIRSILDRLNIPGTITAKEFIPESLPNRTWKAVMTGSDLGLTGSGPVEVQARRWLRAVEEYEARPERYILVKYEDFITDKEGMIADLARKVGLDPVHSIAATKDHSFQRKGNSGRGPLEVFGPENAALIAEICGPAAERLGYRTAA